MDFVLFMVGYFLIALGTFCLVLQQLFHFRVWRFGITNIGIGVVVVLPALMRMGGYL